MRRSRPAVLLAAILAAAPQLARAGAAEDARLAPQGETPGAAPSCLDIRFEGLDPPFTYSLGCNGGVRAVFDTDARGRTRLRFEASPDAPAAAAPRPPAPATPLARREAPRRRAPEPLRVCPASRAPAPLDPVARVGDARAGPDVAPDCDEGFAVEIAGVPEGAYQVWVDGVPRGAIWAGFDTAAGEVRGEIVFDRDADDPRTLPLDFEPGRARIEVLQNGRLLFSGASRPQGP